MKISTHHLLCIPVFLLSMTGFAQDKTLKVGNVSPGEMNYKAFALAKDSRIEITGQAASFRGRHDSWFSNYSDDEWTNNLIYYSWILDAKTREVVWNSIEEYPDIKRSSRERVIDMESTVNLPKGSYEIYYASAKRSYNNIRREDDGTFVGWVRDFFGFDEEDFNSRYSNELYVSVKGPEDAFQVVDIDQVQKDYLKNAIISLEKMHDDESVSKGFSLNDKADLKIYSVGEGQRDGIFDYAWIYDEVNNKIVWRMDWDNTHYAGGAEKNIAFNDEISLPAGTYTVHYVTDDSHSFRRWNSFPPYDPMFWGVAVFPATESDVSKVVPFRKEDIVEPIVALDRVGDDEMVSQGLKVKDDVDLHILCLGESTSSRYNEYADYGWIINADTRETVWTMDRNISQHAGGAEKNRMIDETVNFKPGNYIVYYATDDSHSYRDWNAAAPYDPDKWGITIWPPDNKSKSKMELFDEDEYRDKDVLAEIIRVRDHERLRKSFALDKETRIRVYAIGEGDDDEMYDLGWIENADTGRIVWDMSYRRTENAGGAHKNRSINEIITLPKGNYYLIYRTDGSHSYRNWNADPPRDQESYGITLKYVD